MIAVQFFHGLPQALMRIVLLVPHVLFELVRESTEDVWVRHMYLVIPYFPLLIQRQSDQAVHLLRNRHRLRGVFLLQLKDDFIRFRRYNLGFDGPRRLHELRDTCRALASLSLYEIDSIELFVRLASHSPYHCPAILYRVSQ
jgi:hypothetical protein